MLGADDYYNSYIVSQVQSLRKKIQNDKRPANPFVTISRQTGAYGIAIAKDLCEYLQKNEKRKECVWTVFDKELIEKAAQEHDLPETVLPYFSEDTVSEIQDKIEDLMGLHPCHDALVETINKTILHLAKLGYAIIVGRGANIITAHMPGGVNIRLVSPLEERIKHVQEYYKMETKEAKEFILKEDGRRKNYIKKYFKQDINDPLLYDMVINVGNLEPRATIQVVGELVLKRFSSIESSYPPSDRQ